jgi:hypothetical protein
MKWKLNLTVEVDVESSGVTPQQASSALNVLMARVACDDPNFLSLLLVDTLGRLTKQAIDRTVLDQEIDKYGRQTVGTGAAQTSKAYLVAQTRMRETTAFALSCTAAAAEGHR